MYYLIGYFQTSRGGGGAAGGAITASQLSAALAMATGSAFSGASNNVSFKIMMLAMGMDLTFSEANNCFNFTCNGHLSTVNLTLQW